MMHTIEKASLQVDSRIDMFRKSMKIDVKSCRNGSQFGPWCALGSLRGSKITPKLKKHPKRDAKEAQGRPWGAPGAPQERPSVPKESPERAQERS